jgi:hypothetical protein
MPARLAEAMTGISIWSPHGPLRGTSLLACAALGLFAASFAEAPVAAAASCHTGRATGAVVGQPARTIAWRARLLDPTPVYGAPGGRTRSRGMVAPWQASWLLVLGATRAPDGRCWVKVRLPVRPNNASGWVHAERVRLRPTAWSIAVSLAARTLTILRRGHVARRTSVVIGAPATPTPRGLFSIIGAWRSPPDAFLGSWILPLTAHSTALKEFDGGNGTVGIHGRGGASLLDALGSARSHGCIRLANAAVDWLVHAIGAAELAGTPVWVR